MMLIFVIACFVGLLFTAASLGALAEFSRSKLEKYAESRRIDVLSEILIHDDDALAALRGWTRLLLLGLVIGCVSLDSAAPAPQGAIPAWAARLAVVWVILTLAEIWLARPLGEAFAEPFLYWMWPILNAARIAMIPVLWGMKTASRLLDHFSGKSQEPPTTAIAEEILTVVNEGEREGTIMGDAVDMIAGLMELHEVQVVEIMTPRTEMVMFPITLSIEDARREVTESGHSRIPVYRQNRDDLVGVLYAKDLLPYLKENDNSGLTLADLPLRVPTYVPEGKPVDILLREFQKDRVHMAIVLDEYGGVAGLVTIEDIIEEIVGDIQDEYDEEDLPPIKVIDERTTEVDARIEIESLNESIGLGLEINPDYDTVGGFVFSTLGRIPKSGESFLHDDIRFTVLEASDRAISRLRIERIGENQPVAPQTAEPT